MFWGTIAKRETIRGKSEGTVEEKIENEGN